MYYNEEFNYMLVDIPHISENIENIKRITQLGVEKFKRKFNQSNHSPNSFSLNTSNQTSGIN